MSRFALEVANWAERTKREQSTILRKIALEVFSRVVMRTPVDTGRARGNWQVEIGTPRGDVIDRFDAGGDQTISDAESRITQWDGTGAVFLFNNLPYIMRLEDGWSGQAPNGMVRLTLEEYPHIVREST